VNLTVLTPHFEPDVAPTGAVISRIVGELARRDHTIEVITSLPWYRTHKIEPGYGGRLVRCEDAPWGRVIRINPFATSDKRNIFRRAAGYAGFSALAAALGIRGPRTAGHELRTPVDGVLAMSPPLTLGIERLGDRPSPPRATRLQRARRVPGRRGRVRSAEGPSTDRGGAPP
jgi:colanic acid biosynthesis glycosyl transferase WcaI